MENQTAKKVLVVRSNFGSTQSAEPWDHAGGNATSAIQKHASDAAVANILTAEGWELISVVPVAAGRTHDKELWFQK